MQTLKKEKVFPYTSYFLTECVVENDQTPTSDSFHDHDFYEITIVKSGTMIHWRNEEKETVPADSLLLVYPEDAHYCYKAAEVKTAYVNLAISVALFEKALATYRILTNQDFTPAPANCRALLSHELAKQMISRLGNLESGGYFFREGLSEQLVISILLDTFAFLEQQNESIKNLPGWLQEACSRMGKEENLLQGLPRFIELCGKSQEHVTRTMQKYCQQTPTEYINGLRLEYAASQLTATSKSILDIIYDAGFQNASYFNKLFREKYRMTPSRYRANSNSLRG